MAVAYGKNVRIFVQTKDGETYDLTGQVTSMSYSIGYDNTVQVDLSVFGTNLLRGFSEEWSGVIARQRQEAEWQCSYCGHINPLSSRVCGGGDKSALGCGAARPFYL